MMENNPSQDGCPYYWLNEWLCEYVDGTMDPSVRLVFEEYLEANPELADHVERLCRTRSMLCRCAESGTPSEGMRARLQQRIREEDATEQRTEEEDVLPLASSTRMAMAIASAMVVMLGVGMFVGAAVFTPPAMQRLSATQSVYERPPAQQATPYRTPTRQRLADDREPFQRAPYAAPSAIRPYTAAPASVYAVDTLRGAAFLRSASASP